MFHYLTLALIKWTLGSIFNYLLNHTNVSFMEACFSYRIARRKRKWENWQFRASGPRDTISKYFHMFKSWKQDIGFFCFLFFSFLPSLKYFWKLIFHRCLPEHVPEWDLTRALSPDFCLGTRLRRLQTWFIVKKQGKVRPPASPPLKDPAKVIWPLVCYPLSKGNLELKFWLSVLTDGKPSTDLRSNFCLVRENF